MAVKALATAGAGLLTGLGSEDAEANWVKKGLDEIFNMWHGGGDFEKLDRNFIGTGEGTQAYSRGFYGADVGGTSRVYAENYKKKYTPNESERINLFKERVFTDKELDSDKAVIKEISKIASKSDYISDRELINLIENYYDEEHLGWVFRVRDDMGTSLVDHRGYAQEILNSKLKPNHESKYYLEDKVVYDHATGNMVWEEAATNNVSEAARLAREARERDGITKEQYSKLKNLASNQQEIEKLSNVVKEIELVIQNKVGMDTAKKAYLYNIDFPDLNRENVMMWDMSISKQPKVRELFKSIADKADDLIDPENMTSSKESALEIFKDIARGGKFDEDMLKEIQEYARVSRKEMQGIEDLSDISAGAATWLMESIFGPKQTAKLLSDGGIKASSHFDRKTRNKYRTVPFNQREDIPENTYNHVIYEEMPINILSKEQIGNADPRLLAAMAASGGAASIAAQVDQETLMDQAKSLFSDYLSTAAGALGSAYEGLETSQRGLQGLSRTGYGLLTGESLDEALNQGANVIRQGVEETSQQFGDYIFDKTGSPAAATAGYVGAQFLSPI